MFIKSIFTAMSIHLAASTLAEDMDTHIGYAFLKGFYFTSGTGKDLLSEEQFQNARTCLDELENEIASEEM